MTETLDTVMDKQTIDAKRPAIVFDKTDVRMEMVSVDCVLIEKVDVINILKTLEGLKRKLQPLLNDK